MGALTFEPIPGHAPGVILCLLRAAYAGMLQYDPDFIHKWEPGWKEYDDEIFKYPDTIGKAGFISYAGSDIVGFSSWDPRQWPIGIIGHNCILPEFRDRGYGKQQIKETIKRFQAGFCTKAVVTTSDHPFFLPARRIYESYGFRETRRFTEGSLPMIEYQLILRTG